MDYKTIGHALQVEGDVTHIDMLALHGQRTVFPMRATRDDGIKIFNDVAVKNGLKPLNDPLGYMTLDNSVYQTLHESYQNAYGQAIENINSGVMSGGAYGMRAVLNNVNSKLQNDIKPYLLDEMKYSDLRFIKTTPELTQTANDFAAARVRLTYAHGISRSVEDATMDSIKVDLQNAGKQFHKALNDNQKGVTNQNKLSKARLLQNANNDKESLNKFVTNITTPLSIDKGDHDTRATASFETRDLPLAKFILANKDYLQDYDFKVEKVSGAVKTSWQSELVDKMYQTAEPKMDLSDLDDGQAL